MYVFLYTAFTTKCTGVSHNVEGSDSTFNFLLKMFGKLFAYYFQNFSIFCGITPVFNIKRFIIF